ncbi:MAG: hypothetical protein ABIJ86_16765, partial [Spirochaetota bacterium]
MNLSGIDVFTDRHVEVEVDRGWITSVRELDAHEAGASGVGVMEAGKREAGAARGLPYISPGFLDIQVNGYNGSDYSLGNLNEVHVANIIGSMAKVGVTQHVPTFITMPRERLLRNLALVA